MFVCLCLAVTSHQVSNAVENGACTSKQVANACGAGSDCGRCRSTVREIIAARQRASEGRRHVRRRGELARDLLGEELELLVDRFGERAGGRPVEPEVECAAIRQQPDGGKDLAGFVGA
jgi:bacterioferritin-associated ferredoxin